MTIVLFVPNVNINLHNYLTENLVQGKQFLEKILQVRMKSIFQRNT